ncbi:MAG: dihydropteroate synthase [Thermoleophilaceae bacterium]
MRLALRLRDKLLDIDPGRPLVMGIENASPDSFSGNGHAAGADIVDVGGESGRTDVAPVPAQEEIERVVPVVERLVAQGALVSVDTWKVEVARAVLDAGAVMINDVSGLRDPEIASACAQTGAALVLMHTRGEPKMKEFPGYGDVVGDVVAFLRERMILAAEHGVGEEQIVLDPGPDFAKTPAETVAVLRRLDVVAALGRPVLLAVSRKDFVGQVTGRMPRRRLAGTLAAIADGVDRGAAILRVHDVPETLDYLAVRGALRGEREVHPGPLEEGLRREPAA